jgi:hypothetical protein
MSKAGCGMAVTALVFLVGGAVRIYVRRERSPWRADSAIQYQATRTLVANHRIVAADIVPPPGLPGDLYWRLPSRSALEGHYVSNTVEANAAVTTSNLRTLPVYHTGESWPFIYPLESKPQLADLLDPGMQAALGDVDAQVDQVRCPTGADPSKAPPCFVVLLVPKEKAPDLWKAAQLPPLVPKGF